MIGLRESYIVSQSKNLHQLVEALRSSSGQILIGSESPWVVSRLLDFLRPGDVAVHARNTFGCGFRKIRSVEGSEL